VKSAIQQRARELGFDDCRFTSALPPATAPHFAAWLAARRHGEMGYLARNAAKRVDPQSVLPGAKTIISLAVAYAGDEPPSPTHSAVAQVNPQERPRAKRLDCIAMSPAAPSPPSAGERVGVRIPRNQYSRIEPLNQLAAPLLLPLLGGESRGEGERPTDIPVHGKGPLKVADSNARSATPPGTDSRGVVARYARFADYHDVLGRQLKLLS
jgi:epoxyqueuosine reductase QueG